MNSYLLECKRVCVRAYCAFSCTYIRVRFHGHRKVSSLACSYVSVYVCIYTWPNVFPCTYMCAFPWAGDGLGGCVCVSGYQAGAPSVSAYLVVFNQRSEMDGLDQSAAGIYGFLARDLCPPTNQGAGAIDL